MSHKYKVVCRQCHYNEIVSAGKIIGEHFSSQTYQCLHCEILFDWYTVVGEIPEGISDILFCPMCMRPEILEWDYETGVCPRCCHPMHIVAQLESL